MFQSNERVTVDLSGLVIQGVSFSQNVQKALGTILQQVSTEPSIYKVELCSASRESSGWRCRRSGSIEADRLF